MQLTNFQCKSPVCVTNSPSSCAALLEQSPCMQSGSYHSKAYTQVRQNEWSTEHRNEMNRLAKVAKPKVVLFRKIHNKKHNCLDSHIKMLNCSQVVNLFKDAIGRLIEAGASYFMYITYTQ